MVVPIIPMKVGDLLHKANGFDYFLLEETRNYALIRVMNRKGDPRGFEVWKIRTPRGKYQNKYGLRFPSNEDFGTYGWSYQTLPTATEKYKKLLQEVSE